MHVRLSTWLALAAVVLAPIGVVATLRGVDYKITQALFDLDALRRTIALSVDQRHRLPTEAEGLQSLAQGSVPMMDRVPDDPWLHPYVYRRIAGAPGFVVYSKGADGVDDHGAGDDVTTSAKSYRCETYYDECAGSLPWWRNVALAASFLGGLAWLAFSAVRASVRGVRSARRLRELRRA